ncbi:hypothetical protein F751_2954 [Auxenochlorella protothecoides]|uniref:F-box domain-containing protein n=1 Tax=Auxenochlorella protothecoides TaxID=3075 RepID=A0A087SAK9_AUXPR|nr:hypothetical protein F751_2954 [Auxenochlorella protothecoides]KFM22763.1 hypothetical protein F751_2954 [Auxenochlorella protothecoides]
MLTLPEPLLLRLVCFLSPDDTLSLAQTCRHLARLAGEDLVWRRHFLYRWPDAGMQDEGATPAWKARYMARDRAGVAAVSATGLDPALGPLYRHMADWNAEEGMGGRLGRAFFAGYNAANADELMLRFGVRL